jgi:hypothetical protein
MDEHSLLTITPAEREKMAGKASEFVVKQNKTQKRQK